MKEFSTTVLEDLFQHHSFLGFWCKSGAGGAVLLP
jgi:hypothetical protein